MVGKKRTLFWALQFCFWLAVTALAFNLLRYGHQRVRAQTATPSLAHTVVLRETVIDNKGISHPGMVWTNAVRSDGSKAERFGSADTGGRRIYLASGQKITTKDGLKLKSSETTRFAAEALLDPASNCTRPFVLPVLPPGLIRQQFSVLGEERIAGYRAIKLRADGVTIWRSLDYGCALLQSRMDFGAQGSSEMHLVSLAPGDPDPSLFAVPDDYQEVSPSTMMSKSKDCGPDCQERLKSAAADRLDAYYYSHRIP